MTSDSTNIFLVSCRRIPASFRRRAAERWRRAARHRSRCTGPFEIVNDTTYVYFVSFGTPAGDSFLPDGKVIVRERMAPRCSSSRLD